MDDQCFTDQYTEVLYSMEGQIAGEYRERPELTDYEVGVALDALIKDYHGEAVGHAHKAPQNPSAKPVYDRVGVICEVFLGRAQSDKGKILPDEATLDAEEIVACLKRIRKSVDYWTRESGRQGYLIYIKNFV